MTTATEPPSSADKARWATRSATAIKLRKQSRVLEVAFDDGRSFELPFEYLRVYSPSAEVRGHGPGQETLQLGKDRVQVTGVQPIGNYAVQLAFDDGHNTGLYTWVTCTSWARPMPRNGSITWAGCSSSASPTPRRLRTRRPERS